MNKKESTLTWIFIFLFMLATALFAALWPSLTGSGSNTVPVPVETVYVEMPLLGEVPSTIAMAAIAGGAMILIVVVGAGIGVAYIMLAKIIGNEEASDAYVENRAVLAAQEKGKLAAKNKGRKSDGAYDPSHNKWPAWGTAVLILLLVGSLSVMASHMFWPPAGDVLVNGKIVAKGTNLVTFIMLSTAAILAVFLKPSHINNIDKTDRDSAPWTIYWIILLGLIILGMNFGYMLYANSL